MDGGALRHTSPGICRYGSLCEEHIRAQPWQGHACRRPPMSPSSWGHCLVWQRTEVDVTWHLAIMPADTRSLLYPANTEQVPLCERSLGAWEVKDEASFPSVRSLYFGEKAVVSVITKPLLETLSEEAGGLGE